MNPLELDRAFINFITRSSLVKRLSGDLREVVQASPFAKKLLRFGVVRSCRILQRLKSAEILYLPIVFDFGKDGVSNLSDALISSPVVLDRLVATVKSVIGRTKNCLPVVKAIVIDMVKPDTVHNHLMHVHMLVFDISSCVECVALPTGAPQAFSSL